ncbi:hypothetical protein [Oleiharenicola lentus]|uniref:hypothetical protein n=1 Tax=Oleiharenicola lentus TaxID=2508720 RepID=UPI003F66A12A
MKNSASLRVLALLASVQAVGLAADWPSLTNNSPFGQPPQVVQQQAGEYEFRGIVKEDDITLINVFNSSTQKSQWIPVQGEAGGIAVGSYDVAANRVQITVSGKPQTLTFKQARVALVQAAPLPPPQGMPPPPGGGVQGEVRVANAQGVPGPGGADAQKAFNNLPPEAKSMIDEIRRRRALRAQQVQQPAPATNQATVKPATPNSQP